MYSWSFWTLSERLPKHSLWHPGPLWIDRLFLHTSNAEHQSASWLWTHHTEFAQTKSLNKVWPKFRYYNDITSRSAIHLCQENGSLMGPLRNLKKRLIVICFSAIFLELQEQRYIPINAGLCERCNVISNSEKEEFAPFYCSETLPVTFRVELCVLLPYNISESLLGHRQWRVALPLPPCAGLPIHLRWGHSLSLFDYSGGATEDLWYVLRCPWRSARCLAIYYFVIHITLDSSWGKCHG